MADDPKNDVKQENEDDFFVDPEGAPVFEDVKDDPDAANEETFTDPLTEENPLDGYAEMHLIDGNN